MKRRTKGNPQTDTPIQNALENNYKQKTPPISKHNNQPTFSQGQLICQLCPDCSLGEILLTTRFWDAESFGEVSSIAVETKF